MIWGLLIDDEVCSILHSDSEPDPEHFGYPIMEGDELEVREVEIIVV
jgi:hypothetical protein